MKKILLLAIAVFAFFGAKAESYNTIGLGYNNTQLWSKVTPHFDHTIHNLSGFNLQYNYGIGLGHHPMNIEVGAKVNFDFHHHTEEIVISKYFTDMFLMRVSVPVSYIYHIPVRENFNISPYAGIDLRCNVIATQTEIDPFDVHRTVNMFNKDQVGEDMTWNRFQAGWHAGLRFSFFDYFVGLEYGTDIIPLWSHKFEGEKYTLYSGLFSLNLGYCF